MAEKKKTKKATAKKVTKNPVVKKVNKAVETKKEEIVEKLASEPVIETLSELSPEPIIEHVEEPLEVMNGDPAVLTDTVKKDYVEEVIETEMQPEESEAAKPKKSKIEIIKESIKKVKPWNRFGYLWNGQEVDY